MSWSRRPGRWDGMKRYMIAIVASLTLVVALSGVSQGAEETNYKTHAVVVVVIDGVRYTEGFGDPKRENVPMLSKHLVPLGVLFTNFRNSGATKTNPGHVALVTGRYENVSNNGKQLPSAPTITQLYLKKTGAPSSHAAVIVAKDKLYILANSTGPEWKDKYVATVSAGKKGFGSGYRTDGDTLREILATLKRDHPRVVVINFASPDSTGHSGRWDAYLKAIRDCDQHTYEIYKALQADSFYAGKTALFVTNDHGRHADDRGGFKSHGCSCEGCSRLTLLAVGPDFASGKTIESQAEMKDLAPTVAELLGFTIPQTRDDMGKSLVKLLLAEGGASGKKASPPAEPRVWTSTKGSELEATLVTLRGSKVVLLKADGSTVRIDKRHLSKADQEYLSTR